MSLVFYLEKLFLNHSLTRKDQKKKLRITINLLIMEWLKPPSAFHLQQVTNMQIIKSHFLLKKYKKVELMNKLFSRGDLARLKKMLRLRIKENLY